MKAIWNGAIVAHSEETVVVEGNHYFPGDALKREYTQPSAHTTVCPWKGTANYLSLHVNGQTNENAVWYYAEPKPQAEQIRGRFAFWKGVQVVE
jgi:uncharacterized protein (DUF427 family)